MFAVVTDPDTLRAVPPDTTHVLCFGDSTGSATVTPIGGTPKYSYNWYDAPGGITDSIATGCLQELIMLRLLITDAKILV